MDARWRDPNRWPNRPGDTLIVKHDEDTAQHGEETVKVRPVVIHPALKMPQAPLGDPAAEPMRDGWIRLMGRAWVERMEAELARQDAEDADAHNAGNGGAHNTTQAQTDTGTHRHRAKEVRQMKVIAIDSSSNVDG